jgi:hypothetical protein
MVPPESRIFDRVRIGYCALSKDRSRYSFPIPQADSKRSIALVNTVRWTGFVSQFAKEFGVPAIVWGGWVRDSTAQRFEDLAVNRRSRLCAGSCFRHFPGRQLLTFDVYRMEIQTLVALAYALLANHPPLRAPATKRLSSRRCEPFRPIPSTKVSKSAALEIIRL